jgi:hypothetical protein
MFKKLLGMIGAGSAPAGPAAPAAPREASAATALYDLLFCDDLAVFRPKPADTLADWQRLLFGPAQDPSKVEALALDPATESRVRALAFNWLRTGGYFTPKGIVLGVIIEVPLDQGLDVLAAYADGSARYLNQTGKVAIIEPDGLPEANRQAKRLVELAQPVVAQIGPWDKPRLPPPVRPNIRLTFIVSDGLYFGQGPFQAMQQESLAGPLIQQGSQLLALIVDQAITPASSRP